MLKEGAKVQWIPHWNQNLSVFKWRWNTVAVASNHLGAVGLSRSWFRAMMWQPRPLFEVCCWEEKPLKTIAFMLTASKRNDRQAVIVCSGLVWCLEQGINKQWGAGCEKESEWRAEGSSSLTVTAAAAETDFASFFYLTWVIPYLCLFQSNGLAESPSIHHPSPPTSPLPFMF